MPPSVSGITPAVGVTAGGTPFEITGTGFTSDTLDSVTFGDITYPATDATVASDTSITGVTPAHAAAVVDVSVNFSGASRLLPGGFEFTDAGPDGGSEVATVYSTNRTLARAGTAVDARTKRGPVKYAWDTYECATTTATTKIQFDILLKKGEIPISFFCITDALGSAVTLDLGLNTADDDTVLDVDCFMDGVDVSSAVTVAGGGGDTPDAVTIAGSVTAGYGIGMPLTEDAFVTATVNTASATGTIYVGVLYAANP